MALSLIAPQPTVRLSTRRAKGHTATFPPATIMPFLAYSVIRYRPLRQPLVTPKRARASSLAPPPTSPHHCAHRLHLLSARREAIPSVAYLSNERRIERQPPSDARVQVLRQPQHRQPFAIVRELQRRATVQASSTTIAGHVEDLQKVVVWQDL